MLLREVQYVRPQTVEEALEALASHEGARALAGGQTLLNVMKARAASPDVVVDLNDLDELRAIERVGNGPRAKPGALSGDAASGVAGGLRIGAMVTYTQLMRDSAVGQARPILAEVADQIADVQVRNRGTIGGAAAHADPAADYPAALLALDAEFKLVSCGGERVVPAGSFFVDMMTTALRSGEILAEVRFDADPKGAGSAYKKLHQPASGFAIVGVATRLVLAADGTCRDVRVGITGVAAKPYRATGVESELRGKKLDEKAIARAAAGAARGTEPLADLHASARYRAAMAEVFTRRALAAALARAQKA